MRPTRTETARIIDAPTRRAQLALTTETICFVGHAAVESQTRCAGDASPRAWLTGILKPKIVDLIRRAAAESGAGQSTANGA